jgi:hypothetical protein
MKIPEFYLTIPPLNFTINPHEDPQPQRRKPIMAKKRNGPSKSAAIRDVLMANGKLTAKEVVSILAAKGIKVREGLVYGVKGYMKGRKGRRRKAQQMVARVTPTTGSADAVKTILKIKSWASEVGGLRRLKALVDALSE